MCRLPVPFCLVHCRRPPLQGVLPDGLDGELGDILHGVPRSVRVPEQGDDVAELFLCPAVHVPPDGVGQFPAEPVADLLPDGLLMLVRRPGPLIPRPRR